MFADVVAARALREQIIAERAAIEGIERVYHRLGATCPVATCQRPLHAHRDNLPCQRRNEFDRFGFQR